ncbi:MAG: hypothetical protein IPM04_06460 [Saprospiraceae bacterium]|nr:hypothetical protein [Candidatus Brachybacter algidus]MBK8747505.1 hypothetical protein [Candidatus Brachybacter algidus]
MNRKSNLVSTTELSAISYWLLASCVTKHIMYTYNLNINKITYLVSTAKLSAISHQPSAISSNTYEK